MIANHSRKGQVYFITRTIVTISRLIKTKNSVNVSRNAQTDVKKFSLEGEVETENGSSFVSHN